MTTSIETLDDTGVEPICGNEMSDCMPAIPVLDLSFSPIKRFDFSWEPAMGAELYQVLESPAEGEPYEQVGDDIVGTSISFEMPLHLRGDASYVLRACNGVGCAESAAVDVRGALTEAVGYVKASNTDEDDFFGKSVAMSRDGSTLAVGADEEDSSATGIDGDQANDSASESGAVYVFVRDGVGWSQEVYIKASNAEAGDSFGYSVALSGDGNTLAVSALHEDSSATGVGGNEADNSATDSGAVYVFVRDGAGGWSQQAYIKASNTDPGDRFGRSVALSSDGNTLVVGAYLEESSATGIDGEQADDSITGAGATYVFVRDGAGGWSQQAYIKASNTGTGDLFGRAVAVSDSGNTLAVAGHLENSNATGIGGSQGNESAESAGAVYVFVRDGNGSWSQQAYIKASNTDAGDGFGWNLAISGDGNTLVVSAVEEDGGATGIGGDQADDTAESAGAVYVFVRDGNGSWSQQAYVKASNAEANDAFGWSLAVSTNGNIFAVGAREDSNATGINGTQSNDSAPDSGAVYVFVRDGSGSWSQQAYVKAPNASADDDFSVSVAMSGDGRTLAVSAYEDSSATGIGGDQADDAAPSSGAVYLY